MPVPMHMNSLRAIDFYSSTRDSVKDEKCVIQEQHEHAQALKEVKQQSSVASDACKAEKAHVEELQRNAESLQMDIGKLRADQEACAEALHAAQLVRPASP